MYPLPSSLSPDGLPAYLDIVPTPEGYNHIALFSPASSSSPRFLTVGAWEVTGGVAAISLAERLVYFQAANPSSMERHLYSVPLPKSAAAKYEEARAMTDRAVPAYWSAQFSPEGGFHLLSYEGPLVPWQRVVGQGNWSRECLVLIGETQLI